MGWHGSQNAMKIGEDKYEMQIRTIVPKSKKLVVEFYHL
jgi:hypothetical protein